MTMQRRSDVQGRLDALAPGDTARGRLDNLLRLYEPFASDLKYAVDTIDVVDLRTLIERRGVRWPATAAERSDARPFPAYVELDECYVVGGHVVSDGAYIAGRSWFPEADFTLNGYSAANNPFVQDVLRLEDGADVRCQFRYDADAVRRSGHHFIFNDDIATTNFAHFVFDLLPQLLAFDEAKRRTPAIRVCLKEPFKYPIQTLVMERLVGSQEHWAFRFDRPTRLERCILPTNMSMCVVPEPRSSASPVPAQALRHLKTRVEDAFALQNAAQHGRKIFIDRRDAPAWQRADQAALSKEREFDNLRDLQALLEARGFESVVVSELSPFEIIKTFAEASVIVGVHGAGLANMVFSRPRTTQVLELMQSPTAWKCFARLGAAWGIPVTRIPPLTTAGEGKRLDLAAVEAALA